MREPSAFVITVGSPTSMMETHEFVVPRSIPITFGILRVLPRGALITAFAVGKLSGPGFAFRDGHERGPKQAIVQAIPGLVLLDHAVRLVRGALHVRHRLVV